MELDEYQKATQDTAIYPGKGEGGCDRCQSLGLYYTGLGLGEAGEVQGKIKKIMRDNDGILTPKVAEAIADELGDLLWYVAAATTEINYTLNQIARRNISKLASRRDRGVLGGSGDNR